jgi:hypothetical protein
MVGSSLPPPGRPLTPPWCPTTGATGKTALTHRQSQGSADLPMPRWVEWARRSRPPQQGHHHRGGSTSPQSTWRRSHGRATVAPRRHKTAGDPRLRLRMTGMKNITNFSRRRLLKFMNIMCVIFPLLTVAIDKF